jgi:O-antigen/teichoic acid export membrane protein
VKANRIPNAAAASFGLALGLVGLNFTISLVTARVLGAYGFGIFATSIALLSVLSIPAVLGVDRVVTRSIATYHELHLDELARGILKRTTQFVLVSSSLLAAIAIGILLLASDSFTDPVTFAVAMVALPLLALSRLRQAALLGLGHVIAAQVPEAILRPLAYLAALAVLVLFGATVPPALTLVLYVAAAATAFLMGTVLLRRVTTQVLGHGETVLPARGWWRQALPLTLVSGSGLLIANLPTLVVSALIGPAEAGLFAVAHRAANIQVLGLSAMNTVVGPTIARLTVRSDSVSLQQVLTRAARLAFLVTLAIGGAMVLFRDDLLGLFGAEFSEAALPLVILTTGQLVSAACGSAGTLFVMTSQTRYAAAGFLIAASTTAVLLFLFVPSWGVIGASLATAVGVATLNLSLVFFAWSRKQTDPTIVGRSWRDHA